MIKIKCKSVPDDIHIHSNIFIGKEYWMSESERKLEYITVYKSNKPHIDNIVGVYRLDHFEIMEDNNMSRITEDDEKIYKYNMVQDMSQALNMIKDFEAGYRDPRKGKMIVNHKGVNYLVDVTPIDELPLVDSLRINDYMFNH